MRNVRLYLYNEVVVISPHLGTEAALATLQLQLPLPATSPSRLSRLDYSSETSVIYHLVIPHRILTL
jgi:hypothetical protein